jgi:hypothetical protein
MLDIKLNADGDLDVNAFGDISTTESVRQAVLIRLRWIYDEWRLGPEYGFPWFEEVFVKNPNTVKIKQLIREEILKVSEVRAAEVMKVDYDPAKRTAKFYYTVKVGEETYREEVTLYG